MAFAADQTRLSTQSNARSGHPIDVFVVHHQAVPDGDDGTIGAMVSGSRQVSATWTVDTEGPVGDFSRSYARITAVVPEDRRPWTSASVVDDRALTVECANSSGAPYWGIDPRSFEAVARLIAYGHQAYGIPLQRSTNADPRGVVGHRDVAGIFGGSYATACPGNLDVDQLIARAAELVGSGISSNPLGGNDMGTLDPGPQLDTLIDIGKRTDLLVKQLGDLRPTIIDLGARVGVLYGQLGDLRQTIVDCNARAAVLVDQVAAGADATEELKRLAADLKTAVDKVGDVNLDGVEATVRGAIEEALDAERLDIAKRLAA